MAKKKSPEKDQDQKVDVEKEAVAQVQAVAHLKRNVSAEHSDYEEHPKFAKFKPHGGKPE